MYSFRIPPAGFGDYYPVTLGGKLFVSCYILYCSGVAVLVVSHVKDGVVELWAGLPRLIHSGSGL